MEGSSRAMEFLVQEITEHVLFVTGFSESKQKTTNNSHMTGGIWASWLCEEQLKQPLMATSKATAIRVCNIYWAAVMLPYNPESGYGMTKAAKMSTRINRDTFPLSISLLRSPAKETKAVSVP